MTQPGVQSGSASPTALLAADMARFRTDPYGFVLFAFPWGEPGTDMANMTGPEDWAIELFADIQAHLEGPDWDQPFQFARASGHGITKSATISQLILWALCTRENSRLIVTANTEPQVRTKTWPEITKWFNRCIARSWFTITDTSIYKREERYAKTWRLDRVTWSEHNTDAFQGLHNQGNRLAVFFDEGSNIADKVWEVTEGALTDSDTEILWGVFGNPTRNTGRFFECFHRFRHRWNAKQIDSRTVRVTNKRDIQRKLEDHGEESDYFKVRVRGMFPARAFNQLIGRDVVEAAAKREANAQPGDPLIIGVDVARFGDDATVIRRRRGMDARTYPKVVLRGKDSTQVASHVAQLVKWHMARGERVDAIFVDGSGGYGGGVVDRLRDLGYSPIEVNFGDGSPDHDYANLRAYMWARMADWLKRGAIPDDQELIADLTNQTYGFNNRDQILLTSKEDMKSEGLASPDDGDALAITFAQPVMSEGMRETLGTDGTDSRCLTDYDPFAALRTER